MFFKRLIIYINSTVSIYPDFLARQPYYPLYKIRVLLILKRKYNDLKTFRISESVCYLVTYEIIAILKCTFHRRTLNDRPLSYKMNDKISSCKYHKNIKTH